MHSPVVYCRCYGSVNWTRKSKGINFQQDRMIKIIIHEPFGKNFFAFFYFLPMTNCFKCGASYRFYSSLTMLNVDALVFLAQFIVILGALENTQIFVSRKVLICKLSFCY